MEVGIGLTVFIEKSIYAKPESDFCSKFLFRMIDERYHNNNKILNLGLRLWRFLYNLEVMLFRKSMFKIFENRILFSSFLWKKESFKITINELDFQFCELWHICFDFGIEKLKLIFPKSKL